MGEPSGAFNDLSIEELETEIVDAQEYLQKVEEELRLREETLRSSQKEVKELETKLKRVTVEGGLRRGRVQSLQSIDSYRREVKRHLRKLIEKQVRLKDDVFRAEERRDAVIEEIAELEMHRDARKD